MRKFVVIISMLLIVSVIHSAGVKQQVPKNPVVLLILDTTDFKGNDTIIVNSTKLAQLKSILSDTSDFRRELSRLKNDLHSFEKKNENIIRRVSSTKYLLFVLFILTITGFVLIIVDKKKRRDEILYILTGKKSNNGIHRLSEWKDEIIEKAVEKAKLIPGSAPGFKSDNGEQKLIIEDLQKRIASLEDNLRTRQTEVSDKPEQNTQTEKPVPSTKTLFADAIIKGELHKVTEQPDLDTVYELFLKTPADTTADLSIYKDAYRRVIETTDFIEGCEKQRVDKSPNSLQVEKGEVQKLDTGKWQITKKVNVKFVYIKKG